MRDFAEAGRASTIAGTHHFDLASRATGALRRVFLHVPEGKPPSGGWPVLYATDGNAMIATAVDALRIQASYPTGTNVAPGIIVGLGYPTEDAYDPFRRSWDLGPPPGRRYPPFFDGGPQVLTGGGAEMADFLLHEVRPFVEARVPIDPERQSLFGHSFGGLFALWLLFTRPGAFATWIAASPAITWEDSFLLEHFAAFAAAPPAGLAARVLLSAGEYEGDRLAPFQEGAEDAAERLAEKARTRTIQAAEDLAARLDAVPGVRASCEIHAGETHMSVLPVAINRAVQAAFAIR